MPHHITGLELSILIFAGLMLVLSIYAFHRAANDPSSDIFEGELVEPEPGDWKRLPAGATRRPFDRCWPGTSEQKRWIG